MALLLRLFLLLLVAAPAAALSGVCPDGSIFVVRSAAAIPCPGAKEVDPNDVPPIQPDLLPRPYGWERFNRRADPNNPYNVVEEPGVEPPAPGNDVAAPPPTPKGTLAPATPSVAPIPTQMASLPRRLDLALSESEVADLHEIVSLLQKRAPAALTRTGDPGGISAQLQLAHSLSFEQRVHAALGGPAGAVVLFRAEPLDSGASRPLHVNLTFVQGHFAFHPTLERPDQFGVIEGDLGGTGGEVVLGYAVLPTHLDPARPLDIYWDDHRTTATLRP